MKSRIVAAAVAISSVAVAAPQAMGAVGEPLRNRAGVVIAWEPGSKSNVVVSGSGRVYVVQGLRRYSYGTRVRIRGVKWGRVVRGIKWGFRPSGVKWGIPRARNRIYRSRLYSLGHARNLTMRGIVMKRVNGRVAIAYRGSVVYVPIARRARWTSSTQTLSANRVGEPGSRSAFRVYFSRRGPVVTAAKENRPAVPYAPIPFAGKVRAIDLGGGYITVDATKHPTFPIVLKLTFPESMDLSQYVVGDHVSGVMVQSQSGPELFVTSMSRDNTFAQADSPATNYVAPPPPAEDVAEAKKLVDAWDQGNADGKFTQNGTGLYEGQRQQLMLIARSIQRNQNAGLVELKIDAFITMLADADVGPSPKKKQIDEEFRDLMVVMATELRTMVTS